MLQILEPGILTTLQDLGRDGYQQYGVTRGGAMDPFALRAANALVGNEMDDAAIEVASFPFSVRALEKCIVSISGAEYALRVGERAVPNQSALFLRAGDVLTFDAATWGRYAYLALAGGFDVPRVLGSRATALRDGFGGLAGRALCAGDVLNAARKIFPFDCAGKISRAEFVQYYLRGAPLRILFGPHDEFFDDTAREILLNSEFVVSELSDRMGTRLHGAPIPRRGGEVLSCGIARGAFQIPPNGQPIVLQADHQTTGGYPILAALIRADCPRLAQKRAGEKVSFAVTTVEDARGAWRQAENSWSL